MNFSRRKIDSAKMHCYKEIRCQQRISFAPKPKLSELVRGSMVDNKQASGNDFIIARLCYGAYFNDSRPQVTDDTRHMI